MSTRTQVLMNIYFYNLTNCAPAKQHIDERREAYLQALRDSNHLTDAELKSCLNKFVSGGQ